jgi:hypothetical protein
MFSYKSYLAYVAEHQLIVATKQASKGREVEFYLDVVEELLARGEAGKKLCGG